MLKSGKSALEVLLSISILLCAFSLAFTQQKETKEKIAISGNGIAKMTITTIYDNNPLKEGLEAQWGFSAIIKGAEKTILFDTGGSDALTRNMQKLKIDPNTIDIVVISHNHWDHTGGLESFLAFNSNVTIYVPASFPGEFKDNVSRLGAKLVEVDGPKEICPNIFSTGQMGEKIIEQSLVIRSDKGLIVLTGCAHPGIVKIITAAKNLIDQEILLAMGGFHLKADSQETIEQIIEDFDKLGVKYAAPTHCTGDKARELFKKHFKDKYLPVGLGSTVKIEKLK